MKMLIFSMLAAALLLLAGCAGGQPPQGNQTGLPNPASVYCEQHGGTLEIRTDASGGQYGMCKFSSGKECEEWAYYRGECNPTSGEGNESCICTMEYMPVCGVDGVTYGNACGAGCAGVQIASQGECNSTSGGTGLPNPASVNCGERGGTLEIKEGEGGQYGVCVFTNGAKCEEWALLREECSPEDPNYCEKDSDCACGKHITSGECFFGQKEFVNTAEQCPDFCTGIAAHLQIKCELYQCRQIVNLKKCTDYTAETCPTNCVVCPPCAECSSISCQTGEFCTSIGFNSTWYAETQAGTGASCKNECGNGVCAEVVCEAIGCPCAETKATCPSDCTVTGMAD